jgi:hypothetical protein
MGGKQFAFLVAGDYPNDLNKLSTCLIAEGFKVIVVANCALPSQFQGPRVCKDMTESNPQSRRLRYL